MRFGVLCRGTAFPAWQAACLRELLDSGNAAPALLIVEDESVSRSRWWRRKSSNLLWDAYSRVSAWFSRALRLVELRSELDGVPRLRCGVTSEGEYSQYFLADDVEAIRSHDLDFILRFGFGIIRGDILDAARYGVWSFHHGDEKKYRGGPPAFWEIWHGDAVTGAILQRLTERLDAGVVLRKGYRKTIGWSYRRNRDRLYFETASWPAQVCREICAGHTARVNEEPSSTQAPIRRAPGNARMLLFFAKLARNFFGELTCLTRFDRWHVGIVKRPVSSFLGGSLEDNRALRDVQWLPLPDRRHFQADPFAIRRAGELHILLEDFDYRTSRGQIAAVTARGDDLEQAVQIPDVLTLNCHMSYPCVFEHDGETYCVPETWEAREVSLFRATEFPAAWEKVATLIADYAGVDSTLLRHDDRWWLFGTDEDDEPFARLKVWHAEALEGPWRPHIGNPVKIDERSARPAGPPFVHDGVLYRPAQDCSRRYGGQVALNRVSRLTPTEFAEELIGFLGPEEGGPFPEGVHTLTGVGDVTLVDGVRTELTITSVLAIREKLRWARDRLLGRSP